MYPSVYFMNEVCSTNKCSIQETKSILSILFQYTSKRYCSEEASIHQTIFKNVLGLILNTDTILKWQIVKRYAHPTASPQGREKIRIDRKRKIVVQQKSCT